jgi:hypothetical protein
MYHLKHNTYCSSICKLTGGISLTKQIYYLLVPVSHNFVTSHSVQFNLMYLPEIHVHRYRISHISHSVVLLSISLSGYALLNAS